MGNNSQKKFLYAIICIAALVGVSYLTRDYWYPAMMNNCRACGLKYFPEYSSPSPNVTLIPHQNSPPTYTEPIPSTKASTSNSTDN